MARDLQTRYGRVAGHWHSEGREDAEGLLDDGLQVREPDSLVVRDWMLQGPVREGGINLTDKLC